MWRHTAEPGGFGYPPASLQLLTSALQPWEEKSAHENQKYLISVASFYHSQTAPKSQVQAHTNNK